MPRELSSADVAHLLQKINITFKRHGKEDVYEGHFRGKVRTVIVPRNRKSIPKGTLASIYRQAGLTRKEAEKLLKGEQLNSS
jgi:predicted RNA binding protein YcfA (HicA-like mRNA interferase family)